MELLNRLRRSRPRGDPLPVLEALEIFFEESKRDLEAIAEPSPRRVLVVRRDLDLARPANLVAGALILALGIAIGYWSRNIDSTPIAELAAPPLQSITVSEPKTQIPSVQARPAAVQNNNRSPESSPPDTLLRGVRELLEKIKRGE
ncbi:MAG: hypothetical protein WAP55_02385 [Minisyncoccia bacterium]